MVSKFTRTLAVLALQGSRNLSIAMSTTASSTSTTAPPILPRLGLGMAALGRPGYINLNRDTTGVGDASVRSVEHMRHLAEQVMQCVIDTATASHSDESSSSSTPPPVWFDCARSYGKSEEFVGTFLRNNHISPNDIYVSSKWGYEYVADWNVALEPGQPHEIKDHSVAMFFKQLEETKQCIGEYVNLYQIHSATFESGVLSNTEVHQALAKCRKELGWKLGLSVSSPQQNAILEEAMKITVDGERLFDSVQCTYNLLEQKPGEALLKAHTAGMDIIIKEGMANGRLWNHEVLSEMCERTKSLPAFHIMNQDVTPDQLALGSILAQPFQPRVLSGAVASDHFKSNYEALQVAKILQEQHPELLKELMEKCIMDSDDYWADRAALSWN